MYIPEQGDLIWLSFDPSVGREIVKRRPAFVISKRIFNVHANMAIVAPISNTVRGIKLEVVLPASLKTKGAVMVYQFKAIDFYSREAKFIEKAPEEIVQQVCAIAQTIIQF